MAQRRGRSFRFFVGIFFVFGRRRRRRRRRREEKDAAFPSSSRPPSPPSPATKQKMYAHSGILAAAKAVAADVEREGVVEALLVANGGRSQKRSGAKKGGAESPQQRWRVVVTGHSLGAGVAALVALRLRAYLRARLRSGALSPAFLTGDRPPDVACWAFAPPGGLACPALAAAAAAEGFSDDDDEEEGDEEEEGGKKRAAEKNKTRDDNCCRIVSVAVGKDWIPRLSLSAVERLRDDMVVAAGRCAVPKALLLLGWAVGHRWPPGALFRRPSEVPSGARELVAAFRETLLSRSSRRPAQGEEGGEGAGVAAAAAAATAASSASAAASAAAAALLAEREARLEGARSFVAPGRFMLLRPLKSLAPTPAPAGKKEKKKKGKRKEEKEDASAAAVDLEAQTQSPTPPVSSSSSLPLPRHARAFEAVWVDYTALQQEGILLSTRMALDHLPDYYISVLRRLSRGEYDLAGGGGDRPVSSLGPWDGTMMPPRGLFAALGGGGGLSAAAAAARNAEGESAATVTTEATSLPPAPALPAVALRGRRLSVGEGESRERRAAALEMQRRHRRVQRGAEARAGAATKETIAESGEGPRALPSVFGGGGAEAIPSSSAAAPPPPPSSAASAPPQLQAFGSFFPASPERPPPSSLPLPQPAPTTTRNAALAELARRVSSQSEAEALADGEGDGGEASLSAAQLARRRASSRMRRDASSGLLSRTEKGGKG